MKSTFSNYKNRLKHISYTIKHVIAINKCAKQYNIWNMSYLFHDLDKIVMYLFLPLNYSTKDIHKIHELHSKHHVKCISGNVDWEMAIMDWECARFTKPDKPLNAYETMIQYYPELQDKCIPVMKQIKLI